jgi:Uncharacterized protein conserved in cyanobacteria
MRPLLDVDRPMSVHDLETTPDDGRRYELVDGSLLVTPVPGWAHQEVVASLSLALYAVCPRSLRVVLGPFAGRPDQYNELRPDLLVARYDDLAEECLPTAPLLAVEVTTASTRLIDQTLKKSFYARLGVRSFWLVDPDPERPSLTAYVLDGDDYQEIVTVTGDEPFHATEPFDVTIVPSELVRGLRP